MTARIPNAQVNEDLTRFLDGHTLPSPDDFSARRDYLIQILTLMGEGEKAPSVSTIEILREQDPRIPHPTAFYFGDETLASLQKEAGFKPNRGTRATDEVILTEYCELCSRKGSLVPLKVLQSDPDITFHWKQIYKFERDNKSDNGGSETDSKEDASRASEDGLIVLQRKALLSGQIKWTRKDGSPIDTVKMYENFAAQGSEGEVVTYGRVLDSYAESLKRRLSLSVEDQINLPDHPDEYLQRGGSISHWRIVVGLSTKSPTERELIEDLADLVQRTGRPVSRSELAETGGRGETLSPGPYESKEHGRTWAGMLAKAVHLAMGRGYKLESLPPPRAVITRKGVSRSTGSKGNALDRIVLHSNPTDDISIEEIPPRKIEPEEFIRSEIQAGGKFVSPQILLARAPVPTKKDLETYLRSKTYLEVLEELEYNTAPLKVLPPDGEQEGVARRILGIEHVKNRIADEWDLWDLAMASNMYPVQLYYGMGPDRFSRALSRISICDFIKACVIHDTPSVSTHQLDHLFDSRKMVGSRALTLRFKTDAEGTDRYMDLDQLMVGPVRRLLKQDALRILRAAEKVEGKLDRTKALNIIAEAQVHGVLQPKKAYDLFIHTEPQRVLNFVVADQ